jgi:hypothetical protein
MVRDKKIVFGRKDRGEGAFFAVFFQRVFLEKNKKIGFT